MYFDNPDTQKLTVSGSLYDRDGNNPGNLWVGNNDDSMWKPSSQEFDLKQILEERGGTITVAGDRKSENADVKITVQKIADIN